MLLMTREILLKYLDGEMPPNKSQQEERR
jgi:hypothetical protein